MRCHRALLIALLASAAPSWCAAATISGHVGFASSRPGGFSRSPRSWMSSQAKLAHQLLYVANGSTGVVDVFSIAKSGGSTLVGQIAGFQSPQGMVVDAAGMLYVVNDYIPQEGPVGGEVDVFPMGSTNPSLIVNPYPWAPFDIGVDKSGNMYIANISRIGEFSPGSVTVYDKTGHGPIRTLQGSNLKEVYGIAVDPHSSDVYVSYSTDLGATGHVATFHHGRGNATDLGVSYGTPWGIIQDGSGNLLANDGSGPIHIYAQTGGPQIGSIDVPGGPLFAAFNTDRSLVYVSNFNNFDIEIFRYSDGTMVGTIAGQWSKNAWPTGVAYWPRAK